MIDGHQGSFWEAEHTSMHLLSGLLDSPPIKKWAEALIGGGVKLDSPADCMGTWYKEGDFTGVHSDDKQTHDGSRRLAFVLHMTCAMPQSNVAPTRTRRGVVHVRCNVRCAVRGVLRSRSSVRRASARDAMRCCAAAGVGGTRHGAAT
jgi:hypothetical protein